ncbi:hypothetical protein [Paenibacillus silvisoli]|uniref:hypothetical protein n=1 Tax=Paenibacillus silvisoli TaxID=3110539 RepID=UPI002804ADDA|nr:hypothetical protein [Paenibacillus silvisoli]
MIREEKGSAFLLVVFMMLLFTLVGVAVLGATIGGATRTQRTEDNLQTVHLADKALSEAIAHIKANFDNQTIRPSQLKEKMEQFVGNFNSYDPKDSNLDEAKKPSYMIKNICLLGEPSDPLNMSIVNLYCTGIAKDQVNSNEDYLSSLRVTAEAVVNGVARELVQDVTLDTFPDFLKYAMGSEGEVSINGAPAFKGDIYAGTQLIIQKYANYTFNSADTYAPTQYLYVHPLTDPSGVKNIYVEDGDELGDGKIQIQSQQNIKYRTTPNGTPETLADMSGEEFHGLQAKIELAEKKKFISINVAQSFIDKALDALGRSSDDQLRDDLWNIYNKPVYFDEDGLLNQVKSLLAANQLLTVPTAPSLPAEDATSEELDAYNAERSKYNQAISDLNNQLSNLSGAAYIDGDLTIDDGLNKIYYPNKGISDWLIVNGNLTIRNNNPTPISVRANILVKGNVTLEGNVEMDATIYSLHDSEDDMNEIKDAQIRGMTVNGEKREMVLLANSPIEIYRVTSFEDLEEGYSSASVNTLDGFFYTDKNAVLYGVGSLFWIHGGFFAKNGLEINAVLGNTKPTADGSALDFENQNTNEMNEQKARFVVDYNINVFLHQSVGLPRVNTVRVHVGQKKLLPVSN